MQDTNITTGRARLSFVHVFKPYAYQPGQEEKFSVTILVPKSDVDTRARIDAAIEAATQRGVSAKWNGQRPAIVPIPVYDGDGVKPSDGMPFGDECKGHWVFTASAKAEYPPQVVDASLNPVIDSTEVYSGCYGRVAVNFFPYAYGGKKGIGCGLEHVQKLADGEPLGGSRISAEQAFGAPQPQAQPVQQPTQALYQSQAQPVQQPAQAQQPVQAQQPQQVRPVNPITGQPL